MSNDRSDLSGISLRLLGLTILLFVPTIVRNKMVHDHEFNSLPDRQYFASSYDQVEKELKIHLEKGRGKSGEACTIS